MFRRRFLQSLLSYSPTVLVSFFIGRPTKGITKDLTISASPNTGAKTTTLAQKGEGRSKQETTIKESQKLISVKDFGAQGRGTTDDTAAIRAAITSGATDIFFPKGTYLIDSQIGKNSIEINNVRLFGKATILCKSGGIQLNGNKNKVEDLTIKRIKKIMTNKINYTGYGLGMFGDNNIVENVEIYYMNGPGISTSGRNNTFNHVYCHDNIMGLCSSSRTRNITIKNSRFLHNDIAKGSGADGILFARSNIGVTVINCDISFNAEHGVYFQGQQAIFTNNRVIGNHSNGLKFGSYDVGNFQYDNETLDLWVTGDDSVPGYEGTMGINGFGMADIIISNNTIKDNRGGDGIYFQPSSRDIEVKENSLTNNDIRWTYFNHQGKSRRLEDHYNISIINNTIHGTTSSTNALSSIRIAAAKGILVKGNIVDGEITTYAANVTTAPRLSAKSEAPQIIDNKSQTIRLSRYSGGLCKGNEIEKLILGNNGTGVDIVGNSIKNTRGIDTSRTRIFSKNKIN